MEFKCKNCGGTLTYREGSFVTKCDSCGSSSLIFEYLDRESDMYDEFADEIIEQKETFEQKYADYADDVLHADEYCLSADDFETIIEFFEKAGDYRDSQQLLPLAKAEFCRRISSFEQSAKALQYLDEIPGVEGSEKDAFRQVVLDAGTAFRIEELAKEKRTVITPSSVSFASVAKVVADLSQSVVQDLDTLNDFDRELVCRSQKAAIAFLNAHLGDVIGSATNRAELTGMSDRLRAIQAVHYELRNDDTFERISRRLDELAEKEARAQEVKNRIEAAKRAKEKRNGKIKGVLLILALIVAVAVLVVVIGGYSEKVVTVNVLSKTNVTYNETLVDGHYNAGYFYDFEIDITNDSMNDVDLIRGVWQIENAEGERLCAASAEFQGNFTGRATQTMVFRLNVSKGEAARELWDTQLKDLKITFRIKTICFANGTNKNYSNAPNRVIHDIQ